MTRPTRALIFAWNGPQAEPQFLMGQERATFSLRRGGKHLAIATTALRREFDVFAAQAGLPLERFDCIETDIPAETVARRAGIVLVARSLAESLVIAEEQITMVGDTVRNAEDARAAGVGFIAVASEEPHRQDLLSAGVPHAQMVPDLGTLPDFLGIIRWRASY